MGEATNVSPQLEAALAYARRGWAVFPCHSIRDGRCSCGQDCGRNAGKHPRTAHGLTDASRDEGQIRQWWDQHPDNVAVRTGKISGIWVLDIDVRDNGLDRFEALVQEHGDAGDALIQHTGGGGAHRIYRYPEDRTLPSRNNVLPGIDCKADGGYVLMDPSGHASGRSYVLEDGDSEPGDAPGWLLDLVAPRIEKKKNTKPVAPASPPNPTEIAKVRAAPAYVDADDRDTWVKTGAALKNTWGDAGYDLWTEWSQRSDKFDDADQLKRWDSFNNTHPNPAGIASIFHLAKQAGYDNRTPPADVEQPTAPEVQDNGPPPELDDDRAEAEAVRELEAQEAEASKPILAMGEFQTIDQLYTILRDKIPFLIDDLLPAQGLVLLAGPSGTGKTSLASQWAVCAASETPFCGLATAQTKVGILAADDLRGVARAVAGASAPFQIDVTCPTDAVAQRITWCPDAWTVWPQDRVNWLAEQLHGCGLVVVDGILDFLNGTIKDAADIASFLAPLKLLSRTLDACVVILAHSPWHADREQGSVALRGGCEAAYFLKPLGGKDGAAGTGLQECTLETTKSRWGRSSPIGLRMVDASLQPSGMLNRLVRFEEDETLVGRAQSAQLEEDCHSLLLREKRAGVREITDAFGIERTKARRMLERLRSKGLAAKERDGNRDVWVPR